MSKIAEIIHRIRERGMLAGVTRKRNATLDATNRPNAGTSQHIIWRTNAGARLRALFTFASSIFCVFFALIFPRHAIRLLFLSIFFFFHFISLLITRFLHARFSFEHFVHSWNNTRNSHTLIYNELRWTSIARKSENWNERKKKKTAHFFSLTLCWCEICEFHWPTTSGTTVVFFRSGCAVAKIPIFQSFLECNLCVVIEKRDNFINFIMINIMNRMDGPECLSRCTNSYKYMFNVIQWNLTHVVR